jgi:hypothetical protein
MAIQPIDLQTLFTQVDKMAKTQSAMKDGTSVQQAIQSIQMERKTEQQIQSVNETQNTGDGVEKVKDRRERKHEQADGGKKDQETGEEAEADSERVVFRDSHLGKNIDISL